MQWCKADLHVHTPASKDYQEPNISYLDLLRKAEQEGLDIVAFTDHNTIAGYARLMQEIADLERWEASGRLQPDEKVRLQEYHRLTEQILVLPGVELTATFGFHVLGIFDENTPIRTLEHVLLSLNIPYASLDSGETEVGATSDVLTAYRVLAEAGALVIAAHANSSHGVAMFGFDFGGQTRIAYTQDPHLHALEVTDLENQRRRSTASFFNGSKPQYPRRMHCIQGSDCHRLIGKGKNPGLGERTTEFLLPEVSFKAIKDVLTGDDFTRTRPYRRSEAPFDHVAEARKEGATIVQSFHEGMTKQGGRLHAVVRDVVAFANTNGGTIYVGLSPNARVAPKGVDNPDEAIQELKNEIEHLVTPPLRPAIDVISSDDKNIVRITVPKGDDLPYVLEGSKIYLRQESETSLAMRDEIVALVKRAHGGAPVAPPREPARKPEPARAPKPQPAAAQAQQQAQPQPQPAAQSQRQPQAAQPPVPPQAQAQQPASLPAVVQPSRASMEARPGEVEPPRTGVEIVESEDRQGVLYHTMRDLRDGGEVRNVTRSSARRLWRYAIALKEKGTFQLDKVTWKGNLGLWHKYLRAGRPHYDLAQKLTGAEIRIYYGVTEDGIHSAWRPVVGMED
jgi:hypothetical protein